MDDLFVKAIGKCGGTESSLARACNVSQNAIWAARKAGRVSAVLAKKLEVATEGEVPKWQWRPDLWDAPEPAGAAA